MSMHQHSTDDTARRQAVNWLISLQEHPDDSALRRDFEHWRASTAAHAHAWDELNRLDALIVAAERTPPRRRLPRPPPRLVLAALAACLALVLLPSLQLRWRADAITGTGEIRHLTLADGSHVTLAPDSAIAVSLTADRRLVEVLRGEAFFEVTRDPTRPFTAQAGDSAATVLGTAFNLRRQADGAEISVAEGSVRASRGERGHRLSAGEWIDTTSPDLAVHGAIAAELVASWRHGQLAVKDGKLGDVVDILRRYHPGMIVLRGTELSQRRVTGLYDLTAPEQALAALVAPLGGTILRVTPWLVVVKS